MLSGILETDSKTIDNDILNAVLKMNKMAMAQIKPTTTAYLRLAESNIY